MLREAWA